MCVWVCVYIVHGSVYTNAFVVQLSCEAVDNFVVWCHLGVKGMQCISMIV